MAHRVLVADDDAAIRAVVTEILADEGYEVSSAVNGREALEKIRTEPPEVVLLDLNMPLMNGWEVTEQIQTHGPEVLLVFMTAGRSARAEAERYQVAGYLAKPFDIDDLIDTVARFTSAPSC